MRMYLVNLAWMRSLQNYELTQLILLHEYNVTVVPIMTPADKEPYLGDALTKTFNLQEQLEKRDCSMFTLALRCLGSYDLYVLYMGLYT